MREFSLPAVVRERASLQPNHIAFTFIDYDHDWDGIAESLTWSQLYRRMLNVAHQLRFCGSTGDRAVILAPQGDSTTSLRSSARWKPGASRFRFRFRWAAQPMRALVRCCRMRRPLSS